MYDDGKNRIELEWDSDMVVSQDYLKKRMKSWINAQLW